MKPVDPRVQRFFWEQYLPALHGDGEARRLVDALDETAGLVGCWADEPWVLRGSYVLSPGFDGTSAATLIDALPDVEVEEVAYYLDRAGLIRRVGFGGGNPLWVATADGRMLLSRHENESEPSAAGARFLRGQARTGALAPWRPHPMRAPAQARRHRRRRDVDPLVIRNHYLTAHRRAAGFRTVDFADIIGISERHLRRIEAGTSEGGLEIYVSAARALGVSVDELVPDKLRYAPMPLARKELGLPQREYQDQTPFVQFPSVLRFPPS